MTVQGPTENCGSSLALRSNLDHWILDVLVEPTLVHVNAGLHDLRRTPENGGDVEVPIDEYHRNLANILDRLMAHPLVAHVIVATSTPVDETRHNSTRHSQRLAADVVAYNAYNEVFRELAADRGLTVDDLWHAARNCGFDPLSSDGVHLTSRGSGYVGAIVARVVSELLRAVED